MSFSTTKAGMLNKNKHLAKRVRVKINWLAVIGHQRKITQFEFYLFKHKNISINRAARAFVVKNFKDINLVPFYVGTKNDDLNKFFADRVLDALKEDDFLCRV